MAGGAAFNTSSAGLAIANTSTGYGVFTNVTWLKQSTGTLYSQVVLNSIVAGVANYFFELSNGTTATQVGVLADDANTGDLSGLYRTTLATIDSGVLDGPGTFKIAFAYAAGAQQVTVNGTHSGTDTIAIALGAFSESKIGAGPTGAGRMVGTVKETAFFSTALSSSTLATITTP